MTNYKIENYYNIEAGKIMQLTSDVYNMNKSAILPKKTIVKVLKATPDTIVLEVLQAKPKILTYYYIWTWDRSPGEDFYFFELIKELYEMCTPDLLNAELDQQLWTKQHLIDYIQFLDDQLSEYQ